MLWWAAFPSSPQAFPCAPQAFPSSPQAFPSSPQAFPSSQAPRGRFHPPPGRQQPHLALKVGRPEQQLPSRPGVEAPLLCSRVDLHEVAVARHGRLRANSLRVYLPASRALKAWRHPSVFKNKLADQCFFVTPHAWIEKLGGYKTHKRCLCQCASALLGLIWLPGEEVARAFLGCSEHQPVCTHERLSCSSYNL